MTSSTEITETIVNATPMDTSAEIPAPNAEEKPSNGDIEETANAEETKTGKRKRATKKPTEAEEVNTSLSNGRPRRTLTKREDVSNVSINGGNNKSNKTKAQTESEEQQAAAGDADDEQDRDKNIPIVHDVGNVVWVKMGGHPWWPSLIIRDPNDSSQSFTKISGNARPKRLYFVAFYGSTADFAWVSDAAMISYQGVEAFTKYAQEAVDKAQTKSQKEQLTERFQLKVTIGRREDWELAVREADAALKKAGDARVRDIDTKIEFYTNKLAPSAKAQSGRRTKTSVQKVEEIAGNNEISSLNAADRSLLAEKTFEFKSEDENENDSSMDLPLRKPSAVKPQIKKPTTNGTGDSSNSPAAKRRNVRQSEEPTKTTVFGQNANGSSVSYQQRTESPVKSETNNVSNGGGSAKKRGRPSAKQTAVSSSSEESPAPEFNSASPSVTMKFTTQRKPIIKPQAFNNSSTTRNLDGKHDIRTGFLSASEEQEVLDALEQLRSTKTFDEAEQVAKRRFEHILCVNLNRTHVDVPQEWFYTFLFTHPSLIMKNPQWFTEKVDENPLNETESTSNGQQSNSLAVLKNQLAVLSKLYRNELETRSLSPVKKQQGANISKQKSGVDQHPADEMANDNIQEEEELIN